MLSDAAKTGSEGKGLEKLRAALPKTFDAAAQPLRYDKEKLSQVDLEAQRKQWAASLAKFTCAGTLRSHLWVTAQPPAQKHAPRLAQYKNSRARAHPIEM